MGALSLSGEMVTNFPESRLILLRGTMLQYNITNLSCLDFIALGNATGVIKI